MFSFVEYARSRLLIDIWKKNKVKQATFWDTLKNVSYEIVKVTISEK